MRTSVLALASLLFLGLALSSCDENSGSRTEVANTDIGGVEVEDGGGVDNSELAASIVASPLTNNEIYTSDSADSNCLDFSVTVLDAQNAPLASAQVAFSIVLPGSDIGTLNPDTVATDEAGVASTRYCSGLDQGKGNIQAKVGEHSTTSDLFNVSKKGAYEFAFVSSSVTPTLEGEEPIIRLNLVDSGPFDCTTLQFDLLKNGEPVNGQELTFRTQDDPPRGVKLAKKNEDGVFVTNESNGAKSAVFAATSSSEGRFSVPFCAGVTLGSAVVSADVTDEDGQKVTVNSPVISIRGGVTNYINFSLTFDVNNARTLKGYFNTNSPYEITTQAKVDTRQDGDAIADYPIQVMAETGKASLIRGGRADEESGSASFSMRALHMVDNYAYRMHPFLANPDAASRCDPVAISNSIGNDPGLSFSYKDLSENWRSTVIYAVKGQEHYYDENRNGIYDGNGDGFGDKNQNGVFDGNDVLTFDFNNNMVFDYTGEWFIDLPTPFVDVDENGTYEADRDFILGDSYNEPNGKRDADTIIWKSEVYPVFMGATAYSLQNESIVGGLGAGSLTNGISPGTLFNRTLGEVDLFGGAASQSDLVSQTSRFFHIYAHGICGNPMPGGSIISGSAEEIQASFGQRQPFVRFYQHQDDFYREHSRHFLTEAHGGPSAKINFNVPDHPRKDHGYPVDFELVVPACQRACGGDVVANSEGYACSSQQWEVKLTVKEPDETGGASQTISETINIPSSQTCQCVTGATLINGDCTCPVNTISNGAACVAI